MKLCNPWRGQKQAVLANILLGSKKARVFLFWINVFLACCCVDGSLRAAETKSWVTLTNCEYVVAKYNDGDSFRVRDGTNEFALRLYYVDAPETTMSYPERVRQQAEHFGITMDESLKAGAQAQKRTQELLQEPFIVRTRWASAAGRGRDIRYYGIIEAGGTNLAEVLVSEGLAQAKGIAANLPDGTKSSVYKQKLLDLEESARQRQAGAWAKRPEKAK